MTPRMLLVAITLALALPCASADTVVPCKRKIAFTTKQMGVNFDGRFCILSRY